MLVLNVEVKMIGEFGLQVQQEKNIDTVEGAEGRER